MTHQVVLLPAVVVCGQGDAGVGDARLLGQAHLYTHRRRIKTELKANVVAALWEAEFIKFLAALAVLHCHESKNRMNSTRMI